MSLLDCYNGSVIEAGCDEAGRGSLAGAVFAAAVVLRRGFYNPLLNDSKQVAMADRERLRREIEACAEAWAVAAVPPEEIDRINILNASILAMHIAIDNLSLSPELLLVDGNRFKNYRDIPHRCIVKGDTKYASIAAASILAKTHRDEYMMRINEEFPQYGWRHNMAYPTQEHREAVRRFGLTPYHRRSFKGCKGAQI